MPGLVLLNMSMVLMMSSVAYSPEFANSLDNKQDLNK